MLAVVVAAVLLMALLLACAWARRRALMAWWTRSAPPSAAHLRREPRSERAPTVEEETVLPLAAAAPPPEVQKLFDLRDAFLTSVGASQNPSEWDWPAVCAMGDIYGAGAYPTHAPDANIASDLFAAAARFSTGAAMRSLAMAKLAASRIAVREGTPAALDVGPDPEPFSPWPAETVLSTCKAQRLIGRPYHSIPPSDAGPGVAVPAAVRDPPPRPARVDMAALQNSHDHAVVAGMRAKAKALSRRPRADATVVEEQVRACILDSDPVEVDADAKARALKALDSIVLLNANNASVGSTEVDALCGVWTAISGDSAEAANARETLVKQLSTAVSGTGCGGVVCSTGRMARIIGALDGTPFGAEEGGGGGGAIKDVRAVQEELSTLAARVRTDVMGAATDEARASYESGSDDHGLESKMREALEKEAGDTYVRGMGMSQAVLDPMVKTMMAGF